jgi:arsenate reductase
MPDPVVWFNPSCSKSRTAQGILSDRGIDATYLDYLHDPPAVEELQRVLGMLGATDPRAIARTGEPLWRELGLDDATGDEIVAALAAHPSLIERPIVIVGDRAVVARPPERVLEVLGDAPRG